MQQQSQVDRDKSSPIPSQIIRTCESCKTAEAVYSKHRLARLCEKCKDNPYFNRIVLISVRKRYFKHLGINEQEHSDSELRELFPFHKFITASKTEIHRVPMKVMAQPSGAKVIYTFRVGDVDKWIMKQKRIKDSKERLKDEKKQLGPTGSSPDPAVSNTVVDPYTNYITFLPVELTRQYGGLSFNELKCLPFNRGIVYMLGSKNYSNYSYIGSTIRKMDLRFKEHCFGTLRQTKEKRPLEIVAFIDRISNYTRLEERIQYKNGISASANPKESCWYNFITEINILVRQIDDHNQVNLFVGNSVTKEMLELTRMLPEYIRVCKLE